MGGTRIQTHVCRIPVFFLNVTTRDSLSHYTVCPSWSAYYVPALREAFCTLCLTLSSHSAMRSLSLSLYHGENWGLEKVARQLRIPWLGLTWVAWSPSACFSRSDSPQTVTSLGCSLIDYKGIKHCFLYLIWSRYPSRASYSDGTKYRFSNC